MIVLKTIHDQAIEFTSGVNSNYDSITGEMLDKTITLTKEHRFYFKYFTLYMQSRGKLSIEDKEQLIEDYKEILFEIYKFPQLTELEFEAVVTLYKSKMPIENIAKATGLTPIIIEIALYDSDYITLVKYKPWTEAEIEQLKSYNWSNATPKIFREIAEDIKRSPGAIKSAAKKHGLYEYNPAVNEHKIQKNIENGLPRNAGLRWRAEDADVLRSQIWDDVTPNDIHLLAENLGRTYTSIISKAQVLKLITSDQRMVLEENK